MVHTLMMENICTSLYHGWWFSPRTPVSSITKTGRHHIAEILLKMVLKHQKQNQMPYLSIQFKQFHLYQQNGLQSLFLNHDTMTYNDTIPGPGL